MLSASWNEEFDDNISLPAFRAAILVVVKSGVTHNKNIRLVPVCSSLQFWRKIIQNRLDLADMLVIDEHCH